MYVQVRERIFGLLSLITSIRDADTIKTNKQSSRDHAIIKTTKNAVMFLLIRLVYITHFFYLKSKTYSFLFVFSLIKWENYNFSKDPFDFFLNIPF